MKINSNEAIDILKNGGGLYEKGDYDGEVVILVGTAFKVVQLNNKATFTWYPNFLDIISDNWIKHPSYHNED